MDIGDRRALGKCPLFADIPPERLDSLLLLPGAELTGASKGDIICGPAAFRRGVAAMLSGRAMVRKADGDLRIIISTLVPGSMFGMASVFYEAPSFPTEIKALSPCRMLFLSRDWLSAAFSAEPAVSLNYIALLSERIHFLNRRLDAFAAGDCREKLLRCLSGFCADGSAGFQLPYSMSQLADMLGVGRASLYRALASAQEEGIIRRDGRRFTVLDPERLSGR